MDLRDVYTNLIAGNSLDDFLWDAESSLESQLATLRSSVASDQEFVDAFFKVAKFFSEKEIDRLHQFVCFYQGTDVGESGKALLRLIYQDMSNCLEVMKQSLSGNWRESSWGERLATAVAENMCMGSTAMRVTKPVSSADMVQKFNEMIVLAIQSNAGKLLSSLGRSYEKHFGKTFLQSSEFNDIFLVQLEKLPIKLECLVHQFFDSSDITQGFSVLQYLKYDWVACRVFATVYPRLPDEYYELLINEVINSKAYYCTYYLLECLEYPIECGADLFERILAKWFQVFPKFTDWIKSFKFPLMTRAESDAHVQVIISGFKPEPASAISAAPDELSAVPVTVLFAYQDLLREALEFDNPGFHVNKLKLDTLDHTHNECIKRMEEDPEFKSFIKDSPEEWELIKCSLNPKMTINDLTREGELATACMVR